MRNLAPNFDFMGAFREEIEHLVKQRFGLEEVKERSKRLLREVDRLLDASPGDLRRVLRRIAEGNLGQLEAPAIEALGGRVSRLLKKLVAAIVVWSLISGGSLLVHAPKDEGWHHRFGETMVAFGVMGAFFVILDMARGDRGRGRSRR